MVTVEAGVVALIAGIARTLEVGVKTRMLEDGMVATVVVATITATATTARSAAAVVTGLDVRTMLAHAPAVGIISIMTGRIAAIGATAVPGAVPGAVLVAVPGAVLVKATATTTAMMDVGAMTTEVIMVAGRISEKRCQPIGLNPYQEMSASNCEC